jgi:hypothetical protein
MVRLTDLTLHRRARAVAARWDGYLRGRQVDAPVHPEDEPLVGLIPDLHRMWTPGKRELGQSDPVLANLLAKHTEMNAMTSTATPIAIRPVRPLPHRPQNLSSPDARVGRGTLLISIAAAVLILVVGALAVDRWLDRNKDHTPAIVAPGTPAPDAGIAEETLLRITIPANLLPTGDNVSTGMVRFSIPPGTTATWDAPCCTGPVLDHVLSGVYTVRADGPMTVFRSTGEIEQVPDGTAVTLHGGDSLLLQNQFPVEVSSDSSGPVELLNWVLVDNTPLFAERKLDGWVRVGSPKVVKHPGIVTADLELLLREVTAPGGSVVTNPAGDGGVVLAIAADPDDAFLANISGGSVEINSKTDAEVTVFIAVLTQPAGDGGTPES